MENGKLRCYPEGKPNSLSLWVVKRRFYTPLWGGGTACYNIKCNTFFETKSKGEM